MELDELSVLRRHIQRTRRAERNQQEQQPQHQQQQQQQPPAGQSAAYFQANIDSLFHFDDSPRTHPSSINRIQHDRPATQQSLADIMQLLRHSGPAAARLPTFADGGDEQLLNQLFLMSAESQKGPPPASTAFIRSLPIVSNLSKSGSAEEDCPICSDPLADAGRRGDYLVMLPRCAHIFDRRCIGEWLALHNTCPVCRDSVPTDDVDWNHDHPGFNREYEAAATHKTGGSYAIDEDGYDPHDPYGMYA
ncbi:hypothetical protein GQ42DRAFT_695 [Ramicandelaber brevisporus]|nr:hypothetical protein GQ42DRAFT_33428 [Ramicandelaber brevisporus]KAI8874487.1 hypothetical protein GQ42DRAFT_695 [Ramicandelaber brevisporus]